MNVVVMVMVMVMVVTATRNNKIDSKILYY
jgi:hypothetical protein